MLKASAFKPLVRLSTKKGASEPPPLTEEHRDAPCDILIQSPEHREYMRIDFCSFLCRKRMRAHSHVDGLVRVCLPKRTHQLIIFTLLKSSPSHSSSKRHM